MSLGKADIEDPNPDIHALFCHYNILYFEDSLGACMVSWSSRRMTLCAGVCHYLNGGGCEIRLSEPLLKFRSSADLKNTLLHEMIHAYLWIKNKNRDHSDHGPSFQKLMKEINSSLAIDHQRPYGGYNITIYHSFNDEVDNYRVHHWECQSCGDLIKRAMNREPSASDCIGKAIQDKFCGNLSCHWHIHKMSCTGTYKKVAEPPGYKDKRKGSKGEPECEDLKFKVPTQPTRKSARKAYKDEGSKEKSEVLKSNTIDNFYPIISEANGNLGSPSACGDDNLGNSLSLNSNELRAVEETTQGDAPPVTARLCMNQTSRKKRKSTYVESSKSRKHDNNYTVIINWMRWYANEDDEENIEPLHNKRTEWRRRQKLSKNQTVFSSKVEVMADPLRSSIEEEEFDASPICIGERKSCSLVDGHAQMCAVDANDDVGHFQNGVDTCDDKMQLDTYQTSQGCVVDSAFNHPSASEGSGDVWDRCREISILGKDRDNIVDLSDAD